ncbi:MAG TPA: cell division protein ZapA [candidate division WOR-3 bacterium]|uniref:Cell division protein ZapA n=1 Tax=candidate division WOR-3 bacterium TaxID=2052148 RepID=A0A7V5HQ99_UNCW3|nr:cell division protein ZapA [candidate division WOR-3 bacterium]
MNLELFNTNKTRGKITIKGINYEFETDLTPEEFEYLSNYISEKIKEQEDRMMFMRNNVEFVSVLIAVIYEIARELILLRKEQSELEEKLEKIYKRIEACI